MSKFFLTLFGTLFMMFGLTFLVLFSSFGNNIIKPYVEKLISKKIDGNISFETFKIGFNSLDFHLLLDKNSYVNLKGKYNIFTKNVNLTYKVYLDNLTIKKQLIKGLVDLNGSIIGSLNNIDIKGNGDIFSSKSKFYIRVTNKNIDNLNIDISELPLENLQLLAAKPIYTTGFLSIHSNIKFDDKNQGSGKMIVDINNGTLKEVPIMRDFNITLPKETTYTLKTITDMNKTVFNSIININSSLANITTTKTKFDLNTKYLNSDYKIEVKDLRKLEPIINKKLRGNIVLEGNAKIEKIIYVDGKSDIFDGKLNYILNNMNFELDATSLKTMKILHMLYMPEIFKSDIDLDSNFNILFKKGVFKVATHNGRLVKTKISKTIKTFTRLDITKAIYNDGKLEGTIKDNKINFDLNLNSSKYKISSKNAKIDLNNNFIDSKFTFNINKMDLAAIIKGDLNDPAVSLDSSYLKNKFLNKEREIVNKVKKRLNNKLYEEKDKVKEKLKNKAKDLLKSFF